MSTILTPRENAKLAYAHKIPQWIPCFYSDFQIIQACPEMERYPGNAVGKDFWGVEWTYEPNISAPLPTPGKFLFEDIEDWRSCVKFPDLDAIDWKAQAEKDLYTDFMAVASGGGIVRRKDGKSNYDDDKLRLLMITNGPFERLHAMMGFENTLAALVTDPEECEAYFEAVFNWKIEYVKRIGRYYDIDVINAHDDYGTADRMFMNPELWLRLIKPHLKRLVDACHEQGFLYQHHSCGFVEPIIPDMVEIGADAIDTLQACNTNLAQLKKEFGDRLTFCGGFDNMHVLDVPGVSAEAIKAEYRRVIDMLAPGGSYIIYPIGGAFDFIPTFMEEHMAYGMHFYDSER